MPSAFDTAASSTVDFVLYCRYTSIAVILISINNILCT